MANEEKTAEPVKKHFLTISDPKTGAYAPPNLMELNKASYDAKMASSKRHAASVKRIVDTVNLELKRA